MTFNITSENNIAGFGTFKDFKRYPSIAFGKDRIQAVLPVSTWGAAVTGSHTGLLNTVVDGTWNKCMKDVFTYGGDRAI